MFHSLQLIDLLGFDQFEMVGRLLEVRYKLVDEMSNTKRKVNDAAKKVRLIDRSCWPSNTLQLSFCRCHWSEYCFMTF